MRTENSKMSAPTEDVQEQVSCDDFLLFQNALKKWRLIDDRLIYALNVSLPTKSFAGHSDPTSTCKHLYEELAKTYDNRERSIKKCITQVSSVVKNLQSDKAKKPDDVEVIRHLSTEQRKLRLMQSEMNVEEILRDRSFKVFYERCREYYVPPTAPVV